MMVSPEIMMVSPEIDIFDSRLEVNYTVKTQCLL